MTTLANLHAWLTEALSAGHWVTIKGKQGVTHVYLSDGSGGHEKGEILAGPAGLLGANIAHLPAGPDYEHTHHPAGKDVPTGALTHPDYQDEAAGHPADKQSKAEATEHFAAAHALSTQKAAILQLVAEKQYQEAAKLASSLSADLDGKGEWAPAADFDLLATMAKKKLAAQETDTKAPYYQAVDSFHALEQAGKATSADLADAAHELVVLANKLGDMDVAVKHWTDTATKYLKQSLDQLITKDKPPDPLELYNAAVTHGHFVAAAEQATILAHNFTSWGKTKNAEYWKDKAKEAEGRAAQTGSEALLDQKLQDWVAKKILKHLKDGEPSKALKLAKDTVADLELKGASNNDLYRFRELVGVAERAVGEISTPAARGAMASLKALAKVLKDRGDDTNSPNSTGVLIGHIATMVDQIGKKGISKANADTMDARMADMELIAKYGDALTYSQGQTAWTDLAFMGNVDGYDVNGDTHQILMGARQKDKLLAVLRTNIVSTLNKHHQPLPKTLPLAFARAIENTLRSGVMHQKILDAEDLEDRIVAAAQVLAARDTHEITLADKDRLDGFLTSRAEKNPPTGFDDPEAHGFTPARLSQLLSDAKGEYAHYQPTKQPNFKRGEASATVHPATSAKSLAFEIRLHQRNQFSTDDSAKYDSISNSDAKDEIAKDMAKRFQQEGISEASALAIHDGLKLQGESSGNNPPYYKLADALVHQWAMSSTDNLRGSVALQCVAQRVFGTTGMNWDNAPAFVEPAVWTDVASVVNHPEHGKALEIAVKQFYAATQESFKKHGITHLTLFRGAKNMDIPSLYQDVKGGEGKSAAAVALEAGAMSMNPLSSWSTNPGTARDFSSEQFDSPAYPGYVQGTSINTLVAATIPVENIFSHTRTGQGCLGEDEFVVLGRDTPMVVTGGTEIGDWEALVTQIENEGYNAHPRKRTVKESAPGPDAARCLDWPLHNADWIKQHWTLVGSPEHQATVILGTGGKDQQANLAHFLTLPVARVMPKTVKSALLAKGYRL